MIYAQIFVPLCEKKVNVTQQTQHHFRVTPRIWHPNVSAIDGSIVCYDGETPEQLLTATENFSCPMNIDAAVQCCKNRPLFESTCRIFDHRLHNTSECCICFEDTCDADKKLVCYQFHWACRDCCLKLHDCPMCGDSSLQKYAKKI